MATNVLDFTFDAAPFDLFPLDGPTPTVVAASFFEIDLLAYLGGFGLTVYPGLIPEGESYLPGITVFLISEERETNISGSTGNVEAHYQVGVSGRKYIPVATISEQIRAALQNYRQRPMGGSYVFIVLAGNAVTQYEPPVDGSDNGVHTKIREYVFYYRESIPSP
jgi:hypothetical protein